MSDMSEDEKRKMEANKMFDIAEKPLMEYMCYFYKKTPEELFNDYKDVISDSLIVFPLSNNSKFISFSIEMVDKDYKANVPDGILGHDTIKNTVGFLYNAISCVSNALSMSNIKDEYKEEVDKNFLHFAFDENDFSFHPVYIFWKKRKTIMTQDLLSKIEHTLSNLEQHLDQEECKKQYDELKEYYEFSKKALDEYSYEEEEADRIESETNQQLKNLNKLGIKYVELSFDELDESYKNIIKQNYPHLVTSKELEELEEVVVV